jgi:hypothetical protein
LEVIYHINTIYGNGPGWGAQVKYILRQAGSVIEEGWCSVEFPAGFAENNIGISIKNGVIAYLQSLGHTIASAKGAIEK